MANAPSTENGLSKLEMIVGQVGAVLGTATQYLYKGLQDITPNNTTQDFNYFATSNYARMGAGISLGLVADSLLSKAEEKLHIPKKARGLAAMGAAVLGYAALKHFVINSGSSIEDSYISSFVNTYADYWRAMASLVSSEPRVAFPDIVGGTVMVTTTARALKNLVKYNR